MKLNISKLSRRRTVTATIVAATLLSTSIVSTLGAAAATADKAIQIGISLSLTGNFSDSGNAAQRGYALWAQDVNKRGGILGRRVILKIVNDASSPDQVVTNYTNLILQNKVDLVFGPFSSLLTVPASRVALRYGYSFIEPAGGGPKVFAEKNPNLFFVQPAAVTKGGDIFAKYILSLPAAQRPKTAAYLKLDDPFAAPIANSVKATFEAAGITTVYDQTYPSETADLTPIVAAAAAKNPDIVVSGVQAADGYAQAKAMIQLKFNPKFLFLSNGASNGLEFPKQIGAKNTEGVFTSSAWYPKTTNPGSAAFIKSYLTRYHGTVNQIDGTSAEAYAAGTLLEAVASQTGKVDNATIIKTLHAGSFQTIVGKLSWDAYGEPQGAFELIQWIKGTLTTVYPAALATHAAISPKPDWVG